MSTKQITVKGYVTVVPIDARQSRVAIVQNDVEYRVLPRAAGVDLADEINVQVEATGTLEETEDTKYLTVRIYKVLDDVWDEEDEG